MNRTLLAGILIIGALTAGCASAPIELRTDSSTSAIRAAEEVGANQVPAAALHLQLAKEELDRARVLADKGDKDEATSLLLRAEADAELAILLSRVQSEKADAELAMERVRQLRIDNR